MYQFIYLKIKVVNIIDKFDRPTYMYNNWCQAYKGWTIS